MLFGNITCTGKPRTSNFFWIVRSRCWEVESYPELLQNCRTMSRILARRIPPESRSPYPLPAGCKQNRDFQLSKRDTSLWDGIGDFLAELTKMSSPAEINAYKTSMILDMRKNFPLKAFPRGEPVFCSEHGLSFGEYIKAWLELYLEENPDCKEKILIEFFAK